MGGAPPPPQQPQPAQQSTGYPNVPAGGPNSGGYTLPPTVAYFPVTAYGTPLDPSNQSEMMSQESLNVQQPNTPDLLMHRRQVRLTFLSSLLWLLIGLMLYARLPSSSSTNLFIWYRLCSLESPFVFCARKPAMLPCLECFRKPHYLLSTDLFGSETDGNFSIQFIPGGFLYVGR